MILFQFYVYHTVSLGLFSNKENLHKEIFDVIHSHERKWDSLINPNP